MAASPTRHFSCRCTGPIRDEQPVSCLDALPLQADSISLRAGARFRPTSSSTTGSQWHGPQRALTCFPATWHSSPPPARFPHSLWALCTSPLGTPGTPSKPPCPACSIDGGKPECVCNVSASCEPSCAAAAGGGAACGRDAHAHACRRAHRRN